VTQRGCQFLSVIALALVAKPQWSSATLHLHLSEYQANRVQVSEVVHLNPYLVVCDVTKINGPNRQVVEGEDNSEHIINFRLPHRHNARNPITWQMGWFFSLWWEDIRVYISELDS